jgi:hypothetical protein
MMRAFLSKPAPISGSSQDTATQCAEDGPAPPDGDISDVSMNEPIVERAVFTGYASDLSDDEMYEDDGSGNEADGEGNNTPADLVTTAFKIRDPPPSKQQRFKVPAHVARKQAQEARLHELKTALVAIEKLIASKKEVFKAGQNGLQSYRARAIQSYLHMVVRNKRKGICTELGRETGSTMGEGVGKFTQVARNIRRLSRQDILASF